MAIESAALFLIAATVADELLSSETRPTIQFFVSVWFFDPSRDQPLPPRAASMSSTESESEPPIIFSRTDMRPRKPRAGSPSTLYRYAFNAPPLIGVGGCCDALFAVLPALFNRGGRVASRSQSQLSPEILTRFLQKIFCKT